MAPACAGTEAALPVLFAQVAAGAVTVETGLGVTVTAIGAEVPGQPSAVVTVTVMEADVETVIVGDVSPVDH